MISIFILEYPQPPQGRPRGGGLGAKGGIPPKIKCYVNSRVSIVGISKMISIFILGYPKPPKGRPQGGLGGQRGFSPLLPKIMCYIDSGVLN